MNDVLLPILIFLAASLYSSVGHAGASGYLAAMALVGVAPDIMKPAALVLNILVALITSIRFYTAGHFSWRIFLPFAATSVPCALLGGYLTLPGTVYKQLVGVALLLAAFRLFVKPSGATVESKRPVPLSVALTCGAGIGLLSGLTGVGGGIYLTPLLLLMHWALTREAAGISAAFILVNSIAGLAGHLIKGRPLPEMIPWWLLAAFLGGLIGSHLGSRRIAPPLLRRILAVVLIVAAVKLFFV